MQSRLSAFEAIKLGEHEFRSFLGAVDQSSDGSVSAQASSTWLDILKKEIPREGEGSQQFFRRVSVLAAHRLSKETAVRFPYAKEPKAAVSCL